MADIDPYVLFAVLDQGERGELQAMSMLLLPYHDQFGSESAPALNELMQQAAAYVCRRLERTFTDRLATRLDALNICMNGGDGFVFLLEQSFAANEVAADEYRRFLLDLATQPDLAAADEATFERLLVTRLAERLDREAEAAVERLVAA